MQMRNPVAILNTDQAMYTSVQFSVSQWQHLYSLAQAIRRAQKQAGKRLEIEGRLRKQPLFDNQDVAIKLTFFQVDGIPQYPSATDDRIRLGKLERDANGVFASIPVAADVFEELRSNLVEYGDVDGIHIIVSVELALDEEHWPDHDTVDITGIDYAMRGDA